MLRPSRLFLVVLLSMPFLVVGCKKLNEEKDYDMSPGDWQFNTISPANSDKQITVTATSDSGPIEVTIVVGEKPDDLALVNGIKNPLAKTKDASTDVTLTATVKAKDTFTVCIFAPKKKAKVHLKITAN